MKVRSVLLLGFNTESTSLQLVRPEVGLAMSALLSSTSRHAGALVSAVMNVRVP